MKLPKYSPPRTISEIKMMLGYEPSELDAEMDRKSLAAAENTAHEVNALGLDNPRYKDLMFRALHDLEAMAGKEYAHSFMIELGKYRTVYQLWQYLERECNRYSRSLVDAGKD